MLVQDVPHDTVVVYLLISVLLLLIANAEPNKSIQEIARALTGSLISVKVPYHVVSASQ